MEKIIPEVKAEFEDLKKLSSMLNQKSEFDTPYSFGKIEEWEKINGVKIPDMYKSWLLLTSFARIMDGRIELFFPEFSGKHPMCQVPKAYSGIPPHRSAESD